MNHIILFSIFSGVLLLLTIVSMYFHARMFSMALNVYLHVSTSQQPQYGRAISAAEAAQMFAETGEGGEGGEEKPKAGKIGFQ